MPVSFQENIRPLFRDDDITSMSSFFDLSNYDDVKENAQAIYSRLSDGSMPCDMSWPSQNVDLFKQWMDEGMQP